MSINNSEVDKKIQSAAAKLKKAYYEAKNQNTTTKGLLYEFQKVITNENKVINKYGSIFSDKNLSDKNLSNNNLKKDDFKGFFKYKNNHHWQHIDRHINGVMETYGLAKITKNLNELLYGDKEIDKRFNNFNELKGFGKATITPLLLVTHPEEYGVWNEVSEGCLKTLGIWPIDPDEESGKHLTSGQIYKEVNETLLKLKSYTGLSLWKLDEAFEDCSKSNDSIQVVMEEPNNTVTGETHSPHTTDTRPYQSNFRKGLNEIYDNKCAICGLDIEELLRASHIIPHAENDETAKDLDNGILLCTLHDSLFDSGLITIKHEKGKYNIYISDRLKQSENPVAKDIFKSLQNGSFHEPKHHKPSDESLQSHNIKIFKG
jgi:hypothetical protein